MSKSTLPTRPTASQVREAVRSNEKVMAGLSDRAKANLDSRGRLGAEVVDAYNKGKRADKRYTQGATTVATNERKAQRAALVAKGLAGTRGPLSKEAQATVLSKD